MFNDPVLVGGLILFVVVVGVILFQMGYVKAPPDVAYIISGVSQEPRVVIGKATWKIPFLERLDTLSLRLIKVDVKTRVLELLVI